MSGSIIAICLEDCYPEHESLRYLQCTLLQETGLHVGLHGFITAGSGAGSYCELRVTGDERLACLATVRSRPGARVHRGGRFVDLQPGKPVILCDGDFLAVPGRCYQLHVHGPVARVSEPSFLAQHEAASGVREAASSTLARFAAAGLIAVTGLAGGLGCAPRESAVNEKPDMTRDEPVPPRPEPPEGKEPNHKVDPIDVRDEPPVIAPDPDGP